MIWKGYFLKAHNYFENISGIILGKHEQYDDQKTGKRPHHFLMEIAGEILIRIFESAFFRITFVAFRDRGLFFKK